MVKLYRDLPERSIRLFKLHHRPDRRHTLTGELITARLTDQIKFNALSYVWGTKGAERTIRISGTKLKITKNLDLALRNIRESHCELPIWIDQICINSANPDEKAHQVKFMGQIYAAAQNVLVILCACNILQETPHGPPKSSFSKIKELARMPWETHRSKTPFAGDDEDDIVVIMGVVGCDWWNRMWTVQELIFARNLKFFHHGDEASGEILEHFCKWYMAHVAFCCPYGQNYTGMIHVEIADSVVLAHEMFACRKKRAITGMPMSLLSALVKVQGRESTDPRDKIYALASWTNMPAALIDYRWSPQMCYIMAAVYIIHSSSSLNILNFVVIPQGRPNQVFATAKSKEPVIEALDDLPSWVPDWSSPRKWIGVEKMNIYMRGLHRYRADEDESIHTTIIDVRNLMVRGVRCARIVNTMQFFPEGTTLCALSDIFSLLYGLRDPRHSHTTDSFNVGEHEIANEDSDIFPCTIELVGSANTLTQDQSDDQVQSLQKICQDIHRVACAKFVRAMHSVIMKSENRSSQKPRESPELSDDDGDDDDSILAFTNTIVLRLYSLCRHLIITTDGKLGFASIRTQPGDIVCVLFGGNTPYILREVPMQAVNNEEENRSDDSTLSNDKLKVKPDNPTRQYQVLGEAYVRGIMYGEAIQQLRSGNLIEEDFLLV